MLNFPNGAPVRPARLRWHQPTVWMTALALGLMTLGRADPASPIAPVPAASPAPGATVAQNNLPLAEAAPAEAAPPSPPPAEAASLETFVVALPPGASPRAVPPGRRLTPAAPGLWTHPTAQDHMNTELTYSSFPGLEPLVVDVAGEMDGQQVQSHLTPFHLLEHDTFSHNSLELARGGQGVEIGGDSQDVSGVGAGLRLFTSLHGADGGAGLGLYQRLGTRGFSLLPGADMQWHPGRDSALDMALTADSSLRLTQESRFQGWTVQSFAGWAARQGQSQGSLYLARQWKDTTLFQRFSRSSGPTGGSSWQEGLTRRVGPATLTEAVSLSREAGTSLALTRIGLLRPLGRSLLSLYCERDTANDAGTAQNSTQVSALLTLPLPNEALLFLDDTLLSRSDGPGRNETTASAAWKLGRLWNLQTGLTTDWRASRPRLSAALGFWVTPQWQARLLFGPPVTSQFASQSASAIGFQLVHRFTMMTFASGTVRGRVLLQGQPCAQPLRLQLEDRVAVTDRSGHFQFTRVPVGLHTVAFDLTAFPASLEATQTSQDVQVQQGKTVDLEFSARQVGLVRGHVEVGADAFGQTDPTAALGLILTDSQGHETTTNADHSFTLGSLSLGRQTISLLPSSLPPGYDIVGAGAQDAEVVASPNAARELVFQIAPHRQPVEMKALTP